MPAYAPAAILAVFNNLKALRPGWNLALGGILGDAAHFTTGGYHVPRAYVPAGDYSVQLPQDKLGDDQAASALDVTPQGGTGQEVMRKLTHNLRRATLARDPRIVTVLREFAGTLNNETVFSMDVQRGAVVTGFDTGHLWHVHISILRQYANDATALAGVAEVLAGVPLSKSKVLPPKPTLSDAQRQRRVRYWRDLIQKAKARLARLNTLRGAK